jgi:hypothetical protein
VGVDIGAQQHRLACSLPRSTPSTPVFPTSVRVVDELTQALGDGAAIRCSW